MAAAAKNGRPEQLSDLLRESVGIVHALTRARLGDTLAADEAAREAVTGARAAGPAPRRRSRLPLAVGVAAGLVIAFTLGSLQNGSPDPVAPPAEDAVHAKPEADDERAANQAALEKVELWKKLLQATPGSFAVIAGGELVGIGPDLSALLSRARERHPDAGHRFVFRVGEQGDVTRRKVRALEPVAGTGLLIVDEVRRTVTVAGADPERSGKVLSWKDLPDPRLAIVVGPPLSEKGKRIVFPVSRDFTGPLILPASCRFPLFEIPGLAAVEHGSFAVETRFRRYLVRVRIPDFEVDRLVEGLGGSGVGGDLKFTRRRRVFAGLPWMPFGDEAMAESKRTKKPLLLFAGDLEKAPEAVFDDEVVRAVLQAFVLAQANPWGNEWSGGSPSLLVFYVEGDGPRDFRIGAHLAVTGDLLRRGLLGFLVRAISIEVPTPSNIWPHPIVKPFSTGEQLALLKRVERYLTDPESKKQIRKLIEKLEESLEEKR